MAENPLKKIGSLGQSVWLDQLSRSLISSGELERMIVEDDVRGVTSNPSIFEKAIRSDEAYASEFRELFSIYEDDFRVYEALVLPDIRSACDVFSAVYESSGGADGYVSLEVDPRLAHDAEATVEEARRLWNEVDRPNLMIKVPATIEGLTAIESLLGEGINVNVTLIFSDQVYRKVIDAVLAGVRTFYGEKGKGSPPASVASFFVSRIDTAVDAELEKRLTEGEVAEDLREYLGKAAIANAGRAYNTFRKRFDAETRAALNGWVQRPLWASTSTKNPAYSDVLYLEELIGPETVNTVPPGTLEAFRDHGRPEARLERNAREAEAVLARLRDAEIDLDAVTDRLAREGVAAFQRSLDGLLTFLGEKRREHREWMNG
ncbi:MAG: transaldolase [Candidatus Hydrogenedentota bacterium]|nr:MAG: transaldolase [Candidatus Hydrogenedentota bacterium]